MKCERQQKNYLTSLRHFHPIINKNQQQQQQRQKISPRISPKFTPASSSEDKDNEGESLPSETNQRFTMDNGMRNLTRGSAAASEPSCHSTMVVLIVPAISLSIDENVKETLPVISQVAGRPSLATTDEPRFPRRADSHQQSQRELRRHPTSHMQRSLG